MAWLGGECAIARALVVLAAAGFCSCGRTQLNDVDPCDPAVDTTRPCSGFCGPGTESCVDYAWQACVIPPVTRVRAATIAAPARRPASTSSGRRLRGRAGDAQLLQRLRQRQSDLHRRCLGRLRCAPAPPADPDDDGARLPRAQSARLRVRRHARRSGLARGYPTWASSQSALGADGTPVYAGNPTTPTTTGAANFNEWYHDVPGRQFEDDDRPAADGQRERARLLRLRQPVLLPDRQSAIRQ